MKSLKKSELAFVFVLAVLGVLVLLGLIRAASHKTEPLLADDFQAGVTKAGSIAKRPDGSPKVASHNSRGAGTLPAIPDSQGRKAGSEAQSGVPATTARPPDSPSASDLQPKRPNAALAQNTALPQPALSKEMSGSWCLSLRALAKLALAEPLRPEVQNLGGLGRLEAVVQDPDTVDVILIGQRRPPSPALHLDDLVVNLQAVWNGDGQYAYCSLDPRPQDMLAYQRYLAKRNPNRRHFDAAAFAEFKQLCGPQMVVVGGVPRNSRIAHVMIDADYHMKKICQGHVIVDGLMSTLDLSEQRFRDSLRASGRPAASSPAMSRFWFHVGPGDPRFLTAGGALWLETCAIVLLTERQATAANGQTFDSGQEDPQANAFASSFTGRFGDVSSQFPIYADLSDLFRLQALIRAMQSQGLLVTLKSEIDALIKGYRFRSETPMDPSLPGLANYRNSTEEVPIAGGTMVHTGTSMVMGGVSMDMKTDAMRADPADRLARLRTVVLRSRPSPESLIWPIPRNDALDSLRRGKAQGLSPFEGDEFARMAAGVTSGSPVVQTGSRRRKIGIFEVIKMLVGSFTDLKAFRVADESGLESIIKVLPNDANGVNRRDMVARVEMAKFLAKRGVRVATPLPMRAEDGGEILVTPDAVMIRETVAPGIELGEIARAQQGRLNSEQEALYIDTTLEAAIRGKGVPDRIASKPSVATVSAMRGKHLERAGESRGHFQVFAQTNLYRQKFGPDVSAKGKGFDDAYRTFVEHFWKGNGTLRHVGLVHDAIFPNYFLDGKTMTLIDVGSDYEGSIGNVFSAVLAQLQSSGLSYEEYKGRVEGLFGAYEKKLGRRLGEAERREIVMHLSVQPYKMLSSDSGRMLSELKRVCSLPQTATESELLSAMRQSGNTSKIEEFLSDEVVEQKFQRNMLQIEYSLMLLGEHVKADSSEDRRTLNSLLQQVHDARVSGLRVVSLPALNGQILAAIQ